MRVNSLADLTFLDLIIVILLAIITSYELINM
jgi:hypothetical protein